MVVVVGQAGRFAPGRQKQHDANESKCEKPERRPRAEPHRRYGTLQLVMRGLFRDAALLLIVALVLGTGANLAPSRHLPWWGKGQEPPRAGVDFNLIDPGSADAMRASLPHPIFLDTRSEAEFAVGHLAGARPIAFTALQAQLTPERVKELRAADAVVVYGAGDETDIEQLLAQELHRRGLPPPYVLAGGFAGWQQGGFPVEEGGP